MKAPIQVLIAPNAMKDCLTATDFAQAIDQGLHQADSSVFQTTLLPIADGGDGTCSVLSNILKAKQYSCKVPDPLGRDIIASFGWIAEKKTAIIEMAETSGIHLLTPDERNPLTASSVGLGILVKHVISQFNAKHILLGIGGSATVDCGFGMLKELGVDFFTENDQEIKKYCSICEVQRLETSKLKKLFSDCKVTVLSDVENPLLGVHGAATVFGPQKGACSWMIQVLEQRNAIMSSLLKQETGIDLSREKGSGAAGGVAFPLLALLPNIVQIISGTKHIFKIVSMREHVQNCDVLITGEGSIDKQSFYGKATGELMKLATEYKKPVIALCGQYEGKVNDYPFEELYSINPANSKFTDQIANAYENSVTFVASITDQIMRIKEKRENTK